MKASSVQVDQPRFTFTVDQDVSRVQVPVGDSSQPELFQHPGQFVDELLSIVGYPIGPPEEPVKLCRIDLFAGKEEVSVPMGQKLRHWRGDPRGAQPVRGVIRAPRARESQRAETLDSASRVDICFDDQLLFQDLHPRNLLTSARVR